MGTKEIRSKQGAEAGCRSTKGKEKKDHQTIWLQRHALAEKGKVENGLVFQQKSWKEKHDWMMQYLRYPIDQ
jgi:hypothetical protein